MPESVGEESALLFEGIFNVVSETLFESITGDAGYKTAGAAWVMGGTVAAQGALACPRVKLAYGNGSELKALALAKVLSTAMMSRWFRAFSEIPGNQRPDLKAERFDLLMRLLKAFGDVSPESLSNCWCLDVQFQYDCDIKVGKVKSTGDYNAKPWGVGVDLLGIAALGACAVPGKVDFMWNLLFRDAGRVSKPEDALRHTSFMLRAIPIERLNKFFRVSKDQIDLVRVVREQVRKVDDDGDQGIALCKKAIASAFVPRTFTPTFAPRPDFGTGLRVPFTDYFEFAILLAKSDTDFLTPWPDADLQAFMAAVNAGTKEMAKFYASRPTRGAF